ncbi:MAG: hypothetical protein NTW46_01580 [Candidatus Nealsonbacteria bacterium]|nr:hypothetical protein [Candidatus Nealsonbacteria bacterium]
MANVPLAAVIAVVASAEPAVLVQTGVAKSESSSTCHWAFV